VNVERSVKLSQNMNNFLGWISAEKGLAENTKISYSFDLFHLQEFFEKNKIDEKSVTQRDLQKYIEFLYDMELFQTSISRHISAVRGYYKYLTAEDIINHDPTQNLDMPKLRKYLPDTLCPEDVFKILENAASEKEKAPLRNRAILELLYSTGMRVSECISITTEQFSVNREYMLITGKGNKERLVPVGEIAHKWVSRYVEEERDMFVKPASENYLFINQGRGIGRGKRLTRAAVWNIIKEAVARAGITANVSPHTMRHSFATHLLEGGCDLRIVQEFLGHSNIATTEIYTHVNRTHLIDTHRHFHPRQIKK
jgi:integrase/recombinase XerD